MIAYLLLSLLVDNREGIFGFAPPPPMGEPAGQNTKCPAGNGPGKWPAIKLDPKVNKQSSFHLVHVHTHILTRSCSSSKLCRHRRSFGARGHNRGRYAETAGLYECNLSNRPGGVGQPYPLASTRTSIVRGHLAARGLNARSRVPCVTTQHAVRMAPHRTAITTTFWILHSRR
jgi:hypothetical protein